MRTPPRCILGALALLMSGCAYYDHFDNRVGTYDVVAAQSRDAMILTNVIRASHAEPLSFVQLGQINGSGAAGATAGLPSLILGPHVTAATSVPARGLDDLIELLGTHNPGRFCLMLVGLITTLPLTPAVLAAPPAPAPAFNGSAALACTARLAANVLASVTPTPPT